MQKQKLLKSHNVIIITIRVEIVVAPSTNLIKCGILIGSTIILDSGSSGVSTRRNMSRSFALSITTIRVVGTPQIVFTNLIITTHVNKTTNRPLMNSMATRRYKNADATNPRKGYQEPSVITTQILDHRDGHSVRPNRVALKYLDFKKDVDPDVHVRMFNFVVKENVETSEKYIINVFNYMLRDITLNWCRNYMSKLLDYIVLEFTQAFCKCHQKI